MSARKKDTLTFSPYRIIRRNRWLRWRSRGQVLALALIVIMLFLLAAAVLIDVFHLEEARNWGYRVAQQAAMAGVSKGRDWAYFQPPPTLEIATPPLEPLATEDPSAESPTPECVDPGKIRLIENVARDEAINALIDEMAARGFGSPPDPNWDFRIEVLTEPEGGTVSGDRFPTQAVRLGAGRGPWSANVPAVGVYLNFRVYTFFMSFIGRDSVWINVFAAAEAAQPVQCPTP